MTDNLTEVVGIWRQQLDGAVPGDVLSCGEEVGGAREEDVGQEQY